MLIGVLTVVTSGLIGITLGIIGGFYGGRTDEFVMFLITCRLSIPLILVALTVVALVGSSLAVVILTLGLLLWDRFAVVARTTTMQVRNLDYIAAAQAAGASRIHILMREVLPNIANHLVVVATLEMALAILLEAALSFLGLGVPPPLPSWGLMIAEAKEYMFFSPWVIMIPGVALFVLVLGINLLGDGLRDLLRRGSAAMTALAPDPVLSVANLRVSFRQTEAVRGVSLDGGARRNALPGRRIRLRQVDDGAVGDEPAAARRRPHRRSHPLSGPGSAGLSERQIARLRGDKMAMIFQEPMTSLNPAYTIGSQMSEVLERHRRATRRQAMDRAAELLARVGITAPGMRLGQYPHQLSGGLRQRVMIAMALMCDPELLIADEPTTALDVTVQAQILRLLQKLQQELGLALLLITHDLGVVARMAQRVSVMYAGEVVESGTAAELFAAPTHPYTRGLLRLHSGAGQDADAASRSAAFRASCRASRRASWVAGSASAARLADAGMRPRPCRCATPAAIIPISAGCRRTGSGTLRHDPRDRSPRRVPRSFSSGGGFAHAATRCAPSTA